MSPVILWEQIEDRRAAKPLQNFSCTTELPRTEGGRKLLHPKPWEREVQSHLRQTSVGLKAGQLLLAGRDSISDRIVAAAHLIPDRSSSTTLVVRIAAIGVCTTVRGQGGKVADRTLDEVRRVIFADAQKLGVGVAVATANIHTHNRPSQLLFERAGFEPLSIPAPDSDYQGWVYRVV
ncbi:hypothetical protein [Nocardia rhamnosiphila]|uniref:N-acetyltransferase domain-containing protein n=1 Tax=Nocardia rhamnosiphila TaxID=426716 RepID=A0ABV2WN66_9NOCA